MTDRNLSDGVLVSELTDGAMIAGRLGEDEVVLVRDGEQVHAIGAHCTHYHGPLAEGMLVNGTVRCPWHHACFDLKTGAVLRAPALAPVPVWKVDRRGDGYFVGERIDAGGSLAVSAARDDKRSVVIIGAGPAGINVAETLRTEGFAGRIVIISGEKDLPFDKPNLSKDYLAGNAPVEWLPLYPPEHYEERRIELQLGVTVSSIDTSAKHVMTSSGERLSFDSLVLATGSSPRTLSIKGAENVRYLRTRRDAEGLVASSGTAKRAVIIGSSFIGLEVAASLKQRGVDVTVVSPDRVPLERILGPELGAHIRSIHEKHGVAFRLQRSTTAIENGAVVLDDGERLEAELVAAGIGVTPSIELARASGLQTANGIIVDEYLETSTSGVFACGDIASWPQARTGERRRVEHWVVAGRQGQTVARNILGKRERFATVPFFWSAHFDVVIAYVGYGAGWDAVQIHGSLDNNDATIVYRRRGQIEAVATIGRDRVSLAAEEAMERGDRALLEKIVTG